jgi:hypothetical protein
LKHWATGTVGVKITPDGGIGPAGGAAILLLTSVEGIVSGFFGNGEGFQGRVMASSWISDSSIW